jgi:hypothetical protein
MVTRGGSWRSPTTSIMPRPDSSVVERGPEKAGVGGSIPSLATTSKSLTQWALFEKLQKICKRRMPTLSELWCLVNKHPTAANLGFRQMRCRPFKCSSRCWSRQLTQNRRVPRSRVFFANYTNTAWIHPYSSSRPAQLSCRTRASSAVCADRPPAAGSSSPRT